MNIINVKPNNSSEYSTSLNQSRSPFQICDILLPQDQNGYVNFFKSQKDISYFHIGSNMFLRTTLRKYNAGGYASGTDTVMDFRPFVFIANIFGFIKDRNMIEYTKYQWIDQKHHDILQWYIKSQNIIHYYNEFKFINLLRE